MRPRAVDLRAVVTETVDDVPARPRRRPISVELPAGAAAASRSTTTRIHQVLLNLLENAARYSPDGAPDRGRGVAPSRGGRARRPCAIAARGSPPPSSARIFDRFVRGAAAEGKGGLGLGLYLCRTIVERHGGAIGVDSTAGDGATFWIDLPR